MTNPVVTDDGVVERVERLMRLATPISPIIEREDRRDGGERYIVKGVPCGFPVATFGDCNDAELFVFAATELRAALAASDRDVLVGEPTDAMIEAGRAEAFNQAHRTYDDMCRAIYLAMRDAALLPLAVQQAD